MASIASILGSILLIIFLIVLIAILATIYYFTYISDTSAYEAICANSNNFIIDAICFIYGAGDFSRGVPEGGYCYLPWNCQDWWVFGVTDCCEHTCVKKDATFVQCPIFCLLHPSACQRKSQVDSSDSIGTKICNGRTVELADPSQTCDDFCSRNPSQCGFGLN